MYFWWPENSFPRTPDCCCLCHIIHQLIGNRLNMRLQNVLADLLINYKLCLNAIKREFLSVCLTHATVTQKLLKHTVSQKIADHQLMAITVSKPNRFSKFFRRSKEECVYMGFNCNLRTTCSTFQMWKNLENLLRFDKVIAISWWSTFWDTV